MAIQANQPEVFAALGSFNGSSGNVKKKNTIENAEEIHAVIDRLIDLRKPLSTLKQLSPEEFANSPLGQALSNNVVWKSLTNKDPFAQESAPKKQDIENFFLLVFKFMKADHTMNTQLQLSSMVNMAVQCNMLDRLTSQATAAMQDMDTKVQDALNDKPSIWLSVVLPVAIILVGAIVGGCTCGGGSAAAEVATTSVETEMTNMAEVGANRETANLAENLTSDLEESSLNQTETQASRQTTTQATKQAVQNTANNVAKSAWKQALKKVLGYLAIGAGMGVPSILQASGVGVDKSGTEASAETAMGQAAMSVISSSVEGAQGRVKQETSNQQNYSSNEQADLSMLQQMIQAQQQAFGLGRL